MANISVVVAAYNAEKTINRCILSILNQTYKDFELLIIDDGSKDKTAEILDTYKNNKIKVIHQDNQGIAAVRNKALELVAGDYITFVDSDDYVDKNFLLNLLNGYKNKNIDIGLSIVGVNRVSETGKLIECDSYKEGIYRTDALLNYILSLKGPQGYLCNKLWRMDIIHKYNLRVDSSLFMAEDLEFCVSYIEHISYAYISSKVDYTYVQYKSSTSNSIVLGNNSSRFIEIYKNYILAFKKIIKKIKENTSLSPSKANERLNLIYLNFYRSLMLNNSNEENLKKEIQTKILTNLSSILKSKLPIKTKIAFILVKVNPQLLYKLDKKRFGKDKK